LARKLLKAPEILCLYDIEHCGPTVRFLESIYDSVAKESRLLELDLTGTTRITGAASVVLFANVTAVQLLCEYPPVVHVMSPTDRTMRQHLSHSGLHTAISPGGAAKLERLWNGSNRYQSGVDAPTDSQRTIDYLETIVPAPLPGSVSRAISEAILNVSHHAYDLFPANDLSQALGNRWWQHYNVSGRGISFLIYDRGMGIPRTMALNNPSWKSELLAIEEAMRKGGTRYGSKSGRGNGSEDIKSPVKHGIASLFLMSGGGRFELRDVTVPPVTRLVGSQLSGTLVEWHQKLPMPSDFNQGQS